MVSMMRDILPEAHAPLISGVRQNGASPLTGLRHCVQLGGEPAGLDGVPLGPEDLGYVLPGRGATEPARWRATRGADRWPGRRGLSAATPGRGRSARR